MVLILGGRSEYEGAVNEYINDRQPGGRSIRIRDVSGEHAGRKYTHYFESSSDQPFGVWHLLDVGSRLLKGHPQTMASAFCRDWTVLKNESRVRHAFFHDIAFERGVLLANNQSLPLPYTLAEARVARSGGCQAAAMYLNITDPTKRCIPGLAWLLACLRWHPSQLSASQFVGLR